jgi:hypothetical protein
LLLLITQTQPEAHLAVHQLPQRALIVANGAAVERGSDRLLDDLAGVLGDYDRESLGKPSRLQGCGSARADDRFEAPAQWR